MEEITKAQYDYAQERIDALLPQITENTPMDDPLMVELMIVTDVVERYETVNYSEDISCRDVADSCLM